MKVKLQNNSSWESFAHDLLKLVDNIIIYKYKL